jgi:hypothetical protein
LELNAHVRKGEQGSLVVYADKITRTETDDKTDEESPQPASSATKLPDMTVYFQFPQSPELSRYFRTLALRRTHRRQPETPNVWVWGANGRRVSQGRFRVVGCGAFRLGFDGGLGGEAENMSLFAPVARQVLAQSQQFTNLFDGVEVGGIGRRI